MKNTNKIGFGTAAIGRPQYINIRPKASTEFSLDAFRKAGIEMLESAYEQGVRYFDTAPGYGMAEQLIMDWTKTKNDSNIEIATKWGYTYVANFDLNATQHEVKEHSLFKLNKQWTQSKKLLPLLTTYQIHSATFETGVLDNPNILNRLFALKQAHNIRMGITTTGANQVEVLKKAIDVEINGTLLFDVFQVTYNLFDQSLANVVKEHLTKNKRLVIKEALANGRVFPNDNYPHYAKTYEILHSLANKYGVGIDAIALRFCIDSLHPLPQFKVLSGAATQQQLSENLKTNLFTLTEKEVTILTKSAIAPNQYWSERKQLAWN